MKLSEQLKRARSDRPDEWTMDRYIAAAEKLESAAIPIRCVTFEPNKYCPLGNHTFFIRADDKVKAMAQGVKELIKLGLDPTRYQSEKGTIINVINVESE